MNEKQNLRRAGDTEAAAKKGPDERLESSKDTSAPLEPKLISPVMDDLLPHHRDLLKASAIYEEVARQRGYRSIEKKSDLKHLGFSQRQQNVPGLLIPVFGVAGEIVTYQYRPDSPGSRDGKLVKYETPPKTRMSLDVPPMIREKLADPKTPLFVTEGVRKADSAVSIGLCCIALLGVWNFRGTNEFGGKTFLPHWDFIALNERDVYIAYDSDVVTKAQVRLALERLKGFLESREAKVRIIRLPPGDGGKKTGLDDFLAAGHGVEDLLALAVEHLPLEDGPGSDEEEKRSGPYAIRNGNTCLENVKSDGTVDVKPLCNFAAHIIGEEIHDDGAERMTFFVLEGKLNDGQPLPQIRVPTSRFSSMHWVTQHWGTGPIVFAGQLTKDHLRAAILFFSKKPPKQYVYGHLGWRQIDGRWLFLHAGGAIGIDGSAQSITVELDDRRLSCYALPEPPQDEALQRAVRASLTFLPVGPAHITFPLLMSVCRAPLGEILPMDMSIFLAGPTGSQKTSLSAVVQAHYGSGFHARNLPANWHSTTNALERQCFLTKDVVLVVDDFCPVGTGPDIHRFHREADRLLRGQGNRSGRGRMRSDGGLRPTYFPRGLIVSNGEDVPMGQSLRSRVLILELSCGQVDLELLSSVQEAAEGGILAQAIAGYIRWLAPQIEELKNTLPYRHRELRSEARGGNFSHDRTPDIMANLAVGWEVFILFAHEIGAISGEERAKLWERGLAVLKEVAEAQAAYHASEDPVRRFRELLEGAIQSGHAHVACAGTGNVPGEPQRWGWKRREPGWESQGDCVGWIDGDNLFLEPEAAYAVVQKMARSQGAALPITQFTLGKRMDEKGLLVSRETGRYTVKKMIRGTERKRVLHLHIDALCPPESGAPGATGAEPHNHTGFERPENGNSSENVRRESGAAVQEEPPLNLTRPANTPRKSEDFIEAGQTLFPETDGNSNSFEASAPNAPEMGGNGSPKKADVRDVNLVLEQLREDIFGKTSPPKAFLPNESCRACGRNNYWTTPQGDKKCATCHPAVGPKNFGPDETGEVVSK